MNALSDLDDGGYDGFGEEESSMASLAKGFGLTYVNKPNRIYHEQVQKPIPWADLPLLQQAEDSDLSDLMYGVFGGQPVQGFNLDLVTYREESSSPKRSCVLFQFEANYPTLTVSPHSRLSLAQERDRTPFSQKYRVLGRDPEVAKLVLDDAMCTWLLGIKLPVRLELSGGSLLGHIPKTGVDDWSLFIQTVYGFFIRIPDAAAFRYS